MLHIPHRALTSAPYLPSQSPLSCCIYRCANLACLQPFNNFSTTSLFLPVLLPLHHGQLAVADTGATDHMVPDKSCFISYTSISGLSVQMGNNSYVPVLGRCPAIFALNSKCILVRNVLHTSGLAVPLYSLRTHITQQGCGFIGTGESDFLLYFPAFVLSVNTAVDCHLSFNPLVWSALLATLHYVQPRCPPSLYPSEVSASRSTVAPSPTSPVMIKDNNIATPQLADHPHHHWQSAYMLSPCRSKVLQAQSIVSLLHLPILHNHIHPPLHLLWVLMRFLLQILMIHHCLAFSPLRPPRRLPAFFTILAHPLPWFDCVIPPMPLTQRPIGLRRSSIELWAVGNLEIINISFKSVVMENEWTGASFPPPLVLMPQFQKPNVAACSIALNTFTWMLSTWILRSMTVSLSADIDMLSSLLTEPCDTTGLLALRLSPQRTLYLHSVSSLLRLVHWHVAFTQTAI